MDDEHLLMSSFTHLTMIYEVPSKSRTGFDTADMMASCRTWFLPSFSFQACHCEVLKKYIGIEGISSLFK